MTILSFAAIFAGFGLGALQGAFASAAALVAGVFLGSTAWWLALAVAAGALRGAMRPTGLRWVNRVAGGVIAVFGVVVLASLRGR
jgi:threonine/homoserine/homoserine lactone efflux protein